MQILPTYLHISNKSTKRIMAIFLQLYGFDSAYCLLQRILMYCRPRTIQRRVTETHFQYTAPILIINFKSRGKCSNPFWCVAQFPPPARVALTPRTTDPVLGVSASAANLPKQHRPHSPTASSTPPESSRSRSTPTTPRGRRRSGTTRRCPGSRRCESAWSRRGRGVRAAYRPRRR